jgi:hypothetical protein
MLIECTTHRKTLWILVYPLNFKNSIKCLDLNFWQSIKAHLPYKGCQFTVFLNSPLADQAVESVSNYVLEICCFSSTLIDFIVCMQAQQCLNTPLTLNCGATSTVSVYTVSSPM